MNTAERVPLAERIRLYLSKVESPRRDPSDPQDSHTVVFNATRSLIHGFGLSKEEARPFLEEYLQRSDLPWSESEIVHKLHQVDAQQPGNGQRRGYLCDGADFVPSPTMRRGFEHPRTGKPAEYSEEELKRLAGDWASTVNLVWLANRSAVDPATVPATEFLRMLYRPGEKVLVFSNHMTQGQAVWPDERIPVRGGDGVWFLPQPVDGAYYPNPRAAGLKMSRRSEESVTAFRYMVLESDEAPVRLWLGLLVQLPARIEAIYSSGGKSVHALLRVDCRSKAHWDEERQRMNAALGMLFLGGLDRKVLSAVRLSRLPGCYRESKGSLQKLLYLQPAAEVRPIIERPAVRDVEKTWLQLAEMGISDADETGGVELKNGLRFYAPVSAELRAALDTLAIRGE